MIYYRNSDVELMEILLNLQERTAPVKLSIGYITSENQVRRGIMLHEAPPLVIDTLKRKGYTLDLRENGMMVYKR